MTVADVIKILEALPDKTISLMIDCPFCGRGNQLGKIEEHVILKSKSEAE